MAVSSRNGAAGRPLATMLVAVITRRCCLALTLLAAGCAGASDQISTELVRSGVDPRQARCVGDQLAANLSIGELRQLGRAARVYQEASRMPGGLTIADLVRVAAQLDDARVPLVVGLATVACGVVAVPGL